ncbi:hypothetical protein BDP81DRAFT_445329 [Colletotrichum phormii]|uniref:IBR domain-containing protein n=1 Tax=Colletotrichum phormii TaxID=359342 RepID=A0AAJ0A129_9PEZI|nr:uncharacterized protein BDP81DRAFT_445329 [Colletotrichum phormii]KAK1654515.1 hypothetical protein BDP81DRAFT_445329 [Colletotrichum phormii]
MAFHGQSVVPLKEDPFKGQEQELTGAASTTTTINIRFTHARGIMADARGKDIQDCCLCGKACKKASRKDFPCGCAPYCTTCATAYLRSCLYKPFHKPQCEGVCGSQMSVPDTWARQLLRRAEARTYFDLAAETDEIPRNAALYCQDTACGRYIPPRNRHGGPNLDAGTGNGTGTCPCGKLTCVRCGDEVHQGITCEQIRAGWEAEGKLEEELARQSRRVMARLTIKECPNCHIPAEKIDGGCDVVRFFHWSSAKFKDPRKFAEGKSGDEMPGDDKTEDVKPVYDNMESFEFNPFEDKPASNESAEANSINDKSAETMSVDEKPADTK